MIKIKNIVRSLSFLVFALAVTDRPALAGTTCQPTPQGNLCTSQVDFNSFAYRSYTTQWQSEWCWAACISMIFKYYGHPVRQDRIVATVYGAAYNRPAGAGWVMAKQLNRNWVDDNGNPFTSRLTAVTDIDAGVFDLNNAGMIEELDQNHPLLIASGTHAMVGTAIQYYPSAVVSVGVFDPWPTSGGARGLAAWEMVPITQPQGGLRFAAAVRVE
jgi:hypothetical protein